MARIVSFGLKLWLLLTCYQCPIYARAQDLPHLLELKKAGATDAILENAEVNFKKVLFLITLRFLSKRVCLFWFTDKFTARFEAVDRIWSNV